MDRLSIAWMLAQQAQPDILKTAVSAANSTTSSGTFWENLISFGYLLGVIAAVFIVPFIVAKFLARALRMPDHSGRIGIILASIVGGGLILGLKELRYGPDIKGGTNLVYELDKSIANVDGRSQVKAATLVPQLAQRLNPSGTKEIMIRPSGEDQIEIVVPNVDQMEIDEIKRVIQNAGILHFRIVANQTDHQDIIQLARKQSESENESERLAKEVRAGEAGEQHVAGIWQAVGRDEQAKEGIYPYKTSIPGDILRDAKTGQIIEGFPPSDRPLAFERWLLAKGINDIEILLALERAGKPFEEVTGDHLQTARRSMNKSGFPEVEFTMKSVGAKRLSALTYANRPDPTGTFKRRLAIVLDGRVLSAPQLNQPISSQGVITGSFTMAEVDFLVKILESGSLPAALNKQPISESQVGAAMGQDAIAKAFFACMLSLATTIGFILIYYRFSGFVAALALLLNLLLILAGMIIIQQPITLPGLAGMVLSVGMSVDANVLVFERIREEIAKKSTGRMAIRNGFERAWTTIFDSNFTTLITAVVLYWLGTDQVKGFAITLIIGLIISMFTSVFCSRVLFDIAERWKFASFKMTDAIAFVRNGVFGGKDIDFMSKRFFCYALSGIVILIGVVATVVRGRNLLDIDFNGGTSVIFSIDQPLEVEKVRGVINEVFANDENNLPIQTTLTSVKLGGFEENSVFKLDTSIKAVDDLTNRLVAGFTKEKAGVSLITFSVNATPATAMDPAAATAESGNVKTKRKLTFSTGNELNSAKMNLSFLLESIVDAAKAANISIVAAQINARPAAAADWTPESQVGYSEWDVVLPVDAATNDKIVDQLSQQLKTKPVWQSVNRIESRVANEMQRDAILALIVSILFITVYIWFRFQKVAYGFAAVIALVHDVVITLGFIAISHWLFRPLGFMMIEDFKVSLTIVAALLTVMGYSLNDTIVVFDRIREVKGKSPRLSSEMINLSVNQTLGRTLLTSSTTIMAIFLLYVFGGEGVHGFSYAMLIGILVGTYSSIFVAAPILLWLTSRQKSTDRMKAA